MLSVAIPPDILAALIAGESMVLTINDTEIEFYVAGAQTLRGRVGEELLKILPFAGEKQ